MLEEETTLTFGDDSLVEKCRWRILADSPVVSVTIDREWMGRASAMALSLGVEHAGAFTVDGAPAGDRAAVESGSVVSVPASDVHPAVHIIFRELEEGEVALTDGVLTLMTPPTQIERLAIDVVSGATLDAQAARTVSAALAEPPAAVLFAENPDALIEGPDNLRTTRLVRIMEPLDSPYFVEEDGWWVVRGGQPASEAAELDEYYEAFREWTAAPHRTTLPTRPAESDYLTVKAGDGAVAHVQQREFINNIARPGAGSQHTVALKDVQPDFACTARVLQTTPFVFAPGVEFHRAFAFVKLNGRDWAYFDDNTVCLPNRQGDYSVTVSAPGARREVYLARTAACVTACEWDREARTLTFETDPGDHVDSLPEGIEHRAFIRFDVNVFRLIELENAELVKRVAAAIIVKFRAGDRVVCRFGTFDDKDEKEEEKEEEKESSDADETSEDKQANDGTSQDGKPDDVADVDKTDKDEPTGESPSEAADEDDTDDDSGEASDDDSGADEAEAEEKVVEEVAAIVEVEATDTPDGGDTATDEEAPADVAEEPKKESAPDAPTEAQAPPAEPTESESDEPRPGV